MLVSALRVRGGRDGSQRGFFRRVSRVSLERARRIVFISPSDDPDVESTAALPWLATAASRDKLLALVAAVSAS